jgi:hypothetical protein
VPPSCVASFSHTTSWFCIVFEQKKKIFVHSVFSSVLIIKILKHAVTSACIRAGRRVPLRDGSGPAVLPGWIAADSQRETITALADPGCILAAELVDAPGGCTWMTTTMTG